MLVYDNRCWLRILLQIEGGVLWRTLPGGVLTAIATLLYAVWFRAEGVDGEDDDNSGDAEGSFWVPVIKKTWAADIFGTAISFAIVYRTRISWARYWEAATQVHKMFSKWTDSFNQLISFIATAEKKLDKGPMDAAKEKTKQELLDFRQRLAHDFSLLSAMATHRLTHGDLGRMRHRSDFFANQWCGVICSLCRIWRYWNELIVPAEELRYKGELDPAPHFRVVDPTKRHSYGEPDDIHTPSQPGADGYSSAPIFVILGSLTKEEQEELDGEGKHSSSEGAGDPVDMIMGWINEDLNELGPVTGIAPPIMSRCYQELSNGMLGCAQATKMADIPFPFPFLQLMELLLICYTFFIPIYAARFTGGLMASPFLAMIVTMAFWSLSEISRELETPFAPGPNQLPVVEFHEQFVDGLRNLFRLRRPKPYEVKVKVPPLIAPSSPPQPATPPPATKDEGFANDKPERVMMRL